MRTDPPHQIRMYEVIPLPWSGQPSIKPYPVTASGQIPTHLNIVAGKSYYIGGTSVLSNTTLGSSVVNSSLTSVGTIASGVWQGTAVALAYGGTGATDASGARTNLGLGTIAVQAASNVAITGGTISGVTIDGGTF